MRHNYPKLEKLFAANIKSVLNIANDNHWAEGKKWYMEAHCKSLKVAEATDSSIESVIGVVAAFSPGLSWERNIEVAQGFITTYKRVGRKILKDGYKYGVYGRKNKVKAFRIMEGETPLEVLGGNKVRAFYRNILDPGNNDCVCIDGHSKNAAYKQRLGIHNVFVRPAEYPHIERAYKNVANEVGLVPNQLQAIVWLVWRQQEITA